MCVAVFGIVKVISIAIVISPAQLSQPFQARIFLAKTDFFSICLLLLTNLLNIYKNRADFFIPQHATIMNLQKTLEKSKTNYLKNEKDDHDLGGKSVFSTVLEFKTNFYQWLRK